MLNYIKADLYKTLHRPYLYVTTGVILLFDLVMMILMMTSSAHENVGFIIGLLNSMLVAPVFLILMMVDVVSGDDVREHTFKNTLSYGVSRSKLYISNIIASTIIAAVVFTLIVLFTIGLSFLILPSGNNTVTLLGELFIRILVAVPLYTAAISIGTLLSIILKKSSSFGFFYAMVFLIIAPITNFLTRTVSASFSVVYNLLITVQLDKIAAKSATCAVMTKAAVSGIIYTIIFTVIGIVIFNRQEIK